MEGERWYCCAKYSEGQRAGLGLEARRIGNI